MRKGIFARLSRVVIVLSVLSFVPFLYFYYINTAAYAYLCDDSTYSETGLSCYPLTGNKYSFPWDSNKYSPPLLNNELKIPVERYAGDAPYLIISKKYIQARYKNHSIYNNNLEYHSSLKYDEKEFRKEAADLFKLAELLATGVSNYESKYIKEALVVTIVFTVICPLLILMLIRILMIVYIYIVYGRWSKIGLVG